MREIDSYHPLREAAPSPEFRSLYVSWLRHLQQAGQPDRYLFVNGISPERGAVTDLPYVRDPNGASVTVGRLTSVARNGETRFVQVMAPASFGETGPTTTADQESGLLGYVFVGDTTSDTRIIQDSIYGANATAYHLYTDGQVLANRCTVQNPDMLDGIQAYDPQSAKLDVAGVEEVNMILENAQPLKGDI